MDEFGRMSSMCGHGVLLKRWLKDTFALELNVRLDYNYTILFCEFKIYNYPLFFHCAFSKAKNKHRFVFSCYDTLAKGERRTAVKECCGRH